MSALFSRNSSFRIFAVSAIISILALGGVFAYLGWQALLVAWVLVIIELTFSFDNAIINARVLGTMNPFWQRMFMTLGILIAVFGMRVIFPILIVMFTGGLGWNEVIQLALHQPDKYAEVLEHAAPSIAAFGGMFLLMLTLDFFFDDTREIRWLNRLELAMQFVGRKWLHAVTCVAILLILAVLPANLHQMETLTAGLIGVAVYLAIHGFSVLFTNRHEKAAKASGALKSAATAGFASFIYLEVLDASFSFDGVIGAFAVTKDVILIAIGLGVGALWVRSLTLFIVHKRVLHTYRYLEHGAHYVIGILACSLLVDLFYSIPSMAVGIGGLCVIGASIVSSVKHNKKDDVVSV